MTQYYCDASGGNDANSGLTPLLPKQSILAIQAIASDGDSISLANGTYLSTDGASGATSFVFTKALTIAGQSAFGAVLRSTITGASAATVRVNFSGASGITFQDIVIDSRGIQERGVTRTDAVTDPPVTFTRVWFKDWYQFGIVEGSATTASAYTLTNCVATTDYLGTATGTCYFFFMSGLTNPSVTVSGGTYTMTDPRGSTFNIYGFNIVGAATRVSSTVSITGATISITANSAASSKSYACWIAKCNNVTVSGNTITTNAPGASGVFQGVIISGASGLDANGSVVSGNTIYGYGVSGSCIEIGQGATSDASWGFTENCVVSGNTCIGNSSGANTPHGIVCDGQANVDIHGNYVRQFAPCYLLQRCSGGKVYGNIAIGPYGAVSALYVKGSTGGGFYNNTVYLKSGGAGRAVRVRVGDDATNSSGLIFRNNLIYADAAITDYLVLVDASQAATFDHNLYYSTVALPTACFNYQGTTYDTVAAWAAARETTAVSGAPLLYAPDGDDFRLSVGSAAVAAGAPVFGVKDYTGKRYNPSRPDIGAYVSQRAQTRSSASARTARS